MKAEQIVTGVAINLFAAGATALLTALIWTPGKSDSLTDDQFFEKVRLLEIPVLGKILDALQFKNFEGAPLIGGFFKEFPDPIIVFNNQNPIIYIGILLIPLGHLLLFKSTIGLRIRAIGEYPQAAATAGINVHKYQYFAVILSGMLTGFAGAIIAFELKLFFAEMTLGQGFYSLAIMIFGKWTVFGSLGAALFFGFFRTMSIKIAVATDLAPNTPPPVINVIPNIIALLALAGFIGRARPPGSIGVPYDPNEGE
jgi:simple sugar transport system permease protein